MSRTIIGALSPLTLLSNRQERASNQKKLGFFLIRASTVTSQTSGARGTDMSPGTLQTHTHTLRTLHTFHKLITYILSHPRRSKQKKSIPTLPGVLLNLRGSKDHIAPQTGSFFRQAIPEARPLTLQPILLLAAAAIDPDPENNDNHALLP